MKRRKPPTPRPQGGAPAKSPPRSSEPRPRSADRPRPAEPRSTEPLPPEEPGGRPAEQRIYGLHACLAAFQRRPADLRKVYLVTERINDLKPVLAYCVAHRIGYRVVEAQDLERLSSSRHHEGVCFDVRRKPPLSLAEWLAKEAPQGTSPSALLWLDGVANPHNVGAIVRTSAHFGVDAVLLPPGSPDPSSGASARVARGGAEAVAFVHVDQPERALAELREAGYAVAATVPRDGSDLYETELPRRLVFVFGAEDEGVGAELVAQADTRLRIPGSGAVESLNVAASVAVLLGEHWRQRGSERR